MEEEPRSPVCWWGAAECEPLLLPCPPSAPSYEVQLGDSVVSMSGCSLECWKDMVQKACCPGYWGSQCYGTGVPARLLTLSPAPVASARTPFPGLVHEVGAAGLLGCWAQG